MKTCLDTNTVITDLIPGSKVHIFMFIESKLLRTIVLKMHGTYYNVQSKYFLLAFFNIKHTIKHSFLVFQYKFRVMSASIAGISEASPESEEVK